MPASCSDPFEPDKNTGKLKTISEELTTSQGMYSEIVLSKTDITMICFPHGCRLCLDEWERAVEKLMGFQLC